MKTLESLNEIKKIAIEVACTLFYPVIWLGKKIRDAWDHFTYLAGW